MFNRLSKAIAISALVMTGLGAAAISGDRGVQNQSAASGKVGESQVEADVTTKQTSSAHSSASSSASARSGVSVSAGASASSRVSATAGQGAKAGECAADASATAETNGERVTMRDSRRSVDGADGCNAEAHVELPPKGSEGKAN